MREPLQSLNYPESELVLAIVAPVGTNLSLFDQFLRDRLAQFHYSINSIRLSEFLKKMNLGQKVNGLTLT